MTIHVQRAEPDRASSYILVLGLLCALGAFLFEAYGAPRTVYVEAIPESAKLYIENNVVYELLPCEVTQKNWLKAIWVVADKHYSEKIPISIFGYFTSERHSFEINLKAFPDRPPKPKIIPLDEILDLPEESIVPKRTYSPPPPMPQSKPGVKLPLACRETQEERQQVQNRPPILCYFEDDKAVTLNEPGECYAAYWVSEKGHVQQLQGFGCMHEELTEVARRAFKNRIYLPGLKNGKPVEKVVETEIRYGPRAKHNSPHASDLSASTSLKWRCSHSFLSSCYRA